MKNLNFNPAKSGKEFHKNYKLHDSATFLGESLLTQWGIDFIEFGKDKRYSRVWEKGEDKPDVILKYRDKNAFLDWKSKHQPIWKLNERAIIAYERWSKKYKIPVIIAFFVFNESNQLTDRRLAVIGINKYQSINNLEWDRNKVVEFEKNLPKFTKGNLIEVF